MPPTPTDELIDSIFARLRDEVAAAVSQILLQQSLRPQQLRSQNETLIAQIKASELFVLRRLNHISPPLLPEVHRVDYDEVLSHSPLTPPNSLSLGYSTYGDQPHIGSEPPTTHSFEHEAKEQALVSTQEEVKTPRAENASKKDHEEANQFSDDLSPSNKEEGSTGPRIHNPPADEGQKSVQELNNSPEIPQTPLVALCDPQEGLPGTYQNGLVQGRSNGRPARRPRQIQTRSKTGSKPKRIESSNTDSFVPRIGNTARDGGGNAGPAVGGKSVLARGPEILGNLWDKAGRAGRLEVMREVIYDMISTLRVGVMREPQELNSETQQTVTSSLQSALLQVPEGVSSFQALRDELEMSSAGEQLYRLRRRVALVQFYNDYTCAQADPHAFLYREQNKEFSVESSTATRKRKRASSAYVTTRRGNKLSSSVHNCIVDLMFPSLVIGDEHIESEEIRAKREEKVRKRKAASQKVKNWRANGKPWSALVKRFTWGILLLLPTDLLDQNMRMMKESTLSCFFDALDFFLTDSGCLLPNSTALVQTLLTGQLPPKKLRIEHELPRYGNTDINSLRHFGELLTPYAGDSHTSEESANSTLDHTDDGQRQSLSSNLLRHSPAWDTPLERSVLDSSHPEARLLSEIKTTVIDTESFLSDAEGQYSISARTEGTMSADKLVSPHHFDDAMLVTPFCVPDTDFDHGVEQLIDL